jgi:2-methylisoborneol synthase
LSLLSRVAAPAATHGIAELVGTLLSNLEGAPSTHLPGSPGDASPVSAVRGPVSAAHRLAASPAGLGTSAARMIPSSTSGAAVVADAPKGRPLPSGPTGLGTAALRLRIARRSDETSVPEIYCPPAIRDDPALGDEVNERLVDWAERVGIYVGQLDQVRAANFGRLMMLAHPDTDDPDRLLAGAKCALSEWAVDDHYVDDEQGRAAPQLIGERLALAHAVVDPAQLPVGYAPQLEEAVEKDPVLVALHSSLDNLARYATSTQVTRLRRELAVMFVAYNQEAGWRMSGRTPQVWEYLVHRHENSFLPCMVLIDALGGYEVPAGELTDPRVRRAFTMAGSASVLVNDLYSMAKEDPTDTNLPRLIAAEERCSLEEAVERSVVIHDELVHTFESEATVLSALGSPSLRRFLAGVWAWLGGSREWHRGSARYSPRTG